MTRRQVGTVWVNGYRTVNYDAPGGVNSGFGRENRIELVRVPHRQAVWIELTGARDPFVLVSAGMLPFAHHGRVDQQRSLRRSPRASSRSGARVIRSSGHAR
jgi:hypothetical protein